MTTLRGYSCQIRAIWCAFSFTSTWFSSTHSFKAVLSPRLYLTRRTVDPQQPPPAVTAVAISLLERYISGRRRDSNACKLSLTSTTRRVGISKRRLKPSTMPFKTMSVRMALDASTMGRWSSSRRTTKWRTFQPRIFSCHPSKMG